MSNSTDYEEVQNYAQKLALQKQDVIIAQNEVIMGWLGDISKTLRKIKNEVKK